MSAPPVTLTWRSATRIDVPALNRFTCAPPVPPAQRQAQPGMYKKDRARTGPWWEREAQGGIRSMRPKPNNVNELCLVAVEHDGEIAAASTTCRIEAGIYKIRALAVAMRLRGNGLGTQMLEVTEDRVIEKSELESVDLLTIVAYVHLKNAASEQLFERHGYEVEGRENDYRIWATTLDLESLAIE